MTSNEITLPSAVRTADRLGQGTAVEMSRAVAEVHAAMYGARQFPRDERGATSAMENSCRQHFVAQKAFFRLPRGGEAVTGATVHLARELARCWGHIQYGVVEMRRDDEHAQSEMQAFAWDVQTGTRLVHTFIVPHKRDKKKNGKATPEALVSLQEIYENNSNNGARRVRECIFGVLPPWFTERAKQLCHEALEVGDGTPLSERIEKAIVGFQGIGVSLDQLERKLRLPRIQWTGHEIGLLGTIYSSLSRGEITRDEEFPPERVTGAEIQGAPASKTDSAPDGDQLRDDDPDLKAPAP
jgi:hypothetical protein